MNAHIRTDASSLIGSGHVMRCLTLAKALHKKGITVRFICRPHQGNLINFIHQQGFEVLELPKLNSETNLTGYTDWLGCSEEQDAVDTANLLNQLHHVMDLLIVDHYGLGRTYTLALKNKFRHRMVIDDLANRDHDCETLLDQNLLKDFCNRYKNKVNTGCICLLGPEYALLREEFYQQHRDEKPEKLLIFFGGSDPWQLTLKAVKALQELQHNGQNYPPTDIVIGQNNPDEQALTAAVSSLPDATLHIQTQHMAQLMNKAKLMLGAGGSTHWERCIMGLPGLIITVAENQHPTTDFLSKRDACIWLGEADQITVSQIAQALKKALNNTPLLEQISRNAHRLVPLGGGAQAVVQHLIHQLEKHPT